MLPPHPQLSLPTPKYSTFQACSRPWRLRSSAIGAVESRVYANLYRQYQTYVRTYGEAPIQKIACGANADDYEWTEVLMARAVSISSMRRVWRSVSCHSKSLKPVAAPLADHSPVGSV
jgi:hypothetical protein